MDSRSHSEFSGGKAKISRDVGGKIEVYDGYIDGWNVELAPGRKIVQKWRASDWPDDWYSTASFQIQPSGGGSKLTFVQTDVPEDQYEDISEGWVEHYWDKMKKTIERGRKGWIQVRLGTTRGKR